MLIINKKYRTGKEFKRVMGILFESGAGNQPSDVKKSKAECRELIAECFYVNLESYKSLLSNILIKIKFGFYGIYHFKIRYTPDKIIH